MLSREQPHHVASALRGSEIAPPTQAQPTARVKPPTASASKPTRATTKQTDVAAPQFDFYTILPEVEVAVPENELVEPKPSAPGATQDPASYLLQAGSFRTFDQADRLKASLALLGVPAQIQAVEINQNDRWHRVRIGPFSSAREIDRVRRRLGEEKIHTIMVKLK